MCDEDPGVARDPGLSPAGRGRLAEVQTLLGFYRDGRAAGTFESGIQRALARVLVDPQFLFRFEREPAGPAPRSAYRVGDLDLASRLSFFLWSSIPDEELLDVAAKGALRTPAMLEKQVRRMLADPRSEALVTSFAGQWLFLRELKNVRPDSPDFDGNLRQSMQRETEMLFRTIVARGSQRDRFPRLRLHVRGRAPGAPLRHAGRARLPDAARQHTCGQSSSRLARARQHPDADIGREPHIAVCGANGFSRTLGAPPPNPPPGVETNLEKDPQQVKVDVAASAARDASRQPAVRVVPPPDGSDRALRSKTSTTRASGARSTAKRRSMRPADSPTAR